MQLRNYHCVNSKIKENVSSGSQFYSCTTAWCQGKGLWRPERNGFVRKKNTATTWSQRTHGLFKLFNAVCKVSCPSFISPRQIRKQQVWWTLQSAEIHIAGLSGHIARWLRIGSDDTASAGILSSDSAPPKHWKCHERQKVRVASF